MRLLFVSFIPDSNQTGMGRWTHAVARELTEMGDETTLWFSNSFATTARFGRFAVLTFPVVLLDAVRRNKRDFDAILVHEASASAVTMARRFDKSMPPVVTVCHNVESKVFIRMKEAHRRGLARIAPGSRIKTPLLRTSQSDFAIRTADRVICLSNEDRNYIAGALNVPEKRVSVTANGVDVDAFGSLAGDRRPHTRGPLRVLFIGGWLDVKGSRVLSRIWKSLDDHDDIRLTLAGTGSGGDAVLRELGRAPDRVDVIPRYNPASELPGLLAGHDCLLMPSISEGSPLSLIEAMAAGLPALASNTGGIPDIVSDEVNGLLFDPFDPGEAVAQLRRLAVDRGFLSMLGQAAAQDARDLTWRETARVVRLAAEEATG